MKILIKKTLIVSFIILFALAVAVGYFYSGVIGKAIFSIKPKNADKNPGSPNKLIVTKDNLAQYISSQELTKNLPKSGKIMLQLYNFKSGEREWEESYIITTGKAIQEDEPFEDRVDAIIILDSKYIDELGKRGFCGTLSYANQNGDLGSELLISEAEFLLKYMGIMKYKSCIGM